MSDETPAPESWSMTAQEARDLTRLNDALAALQAQFNAVANAFGKRVGLPDGTRARFDLDKCEWVREG